MMNYLFYIVTFICLMTLQTTVFPFFSMFRNFYDLGVPFVIYIGMFRSIREGILVILFLGLLRDGLSGGQFGLYVTVYLWLFLGASFIVRVCHERNRIIMFLIVVMGVVIGNFILFTITAMLEPATGRCYLFLKTISKQIIWAVFTGQLFLVVFLRVQERMETFIHRISSE